MPSPHGSSGLWKTNYRWLECIHPPCEGTKIGYRGTSRTIVCQENPRSQMRLKLDAAGCCSGSVPPQLHPIRGGGVAEGGWMGVTNCQKG